MDTLLQDLRFALRMLAKSPGFTLVAVVCMALGIGVNTTIFSVVNAILLRPLPFADPEGLAVVRGTQVKNDIDEAGLSWLDFRDLREQTRAFSQVVATTGRSLTLSGGGAEPERVIGGVISAGLFPMIGEQPIRGRNFRAEEDRAGAPGVVILSHALWKRRYEGDPAIVGRTILVNAAAHTVVGVMKPLFAFPEEAEAWVPLAPLVHAEGRAERSLWVLGRLAPGVTVERANAEVEAFAKRQAERYPDADAGWGGAVVTLRRDAVEEELELMILTMMGAVTFVLLIACANVANLMLARATGRQREIAIRAAFGARRGRLVRQLLTESVVVALAGGALGVLVAVWGIKLLYAAIPADNPPPYWMQFTIDGPVLLYTLGVALATGLVFGLAPALQAARPALHGTMQEGGRGAGGSVARNRLRSGLVVVEVALALVLLVGASLFVRSFMALHDASGGFATEHLLTLRVHLPGEAYDDDGAKTRRIEDLVRRLEAVPGVEAVGASNLIPLGGGGSGGRMLIEGRAVAPGEEPQIYYTGITERFFQAVGVEPLAGRGLTAAEARERSAVALVNETFVRRFWAEAARPAGLLDTARKPSRLGGDALGRRFRLKDEADPRWITIVGIVPDIQNGDLNDDLEPSAYLAFPYLAIRNTGFVLRTRGDPLQVAQAARRAIRAADPNLPVFQVAPMEKVRMDGVWEYALFGKMFSTFGGVALFLAAIGVYGVLAYAVGQRLREIGVRVALGAQRADVLRLVVRQGLVLAGAGVALGLLGAIGVTRVVGGFLYEVSPTDPLSFVSISALLTAIACLASYVPARRATQVDPLEALRVE
jgi:putative ABC transport system permease protein